MNESLTPTSRWPLVIPIGWTKWESGALKALLHDSSNGLRATFALEYYPGGNDRNLFGPLETPGWWKRVVISRKNMYPTWDEMRDFIRACPFFDRDRDVIMVMPPDREYVNKHPNAFHWWQKE